MLQQRSLASLILIAILVHRRPVYAQNIAKCVCDPIQGHAYTRPTVHPPTSTAPITTVATTTASTSTMPTTTSSSPPPTTAKPTTTMSASTLRPSSAQPSTTTGTTTNTVQTSTSAEPSTESTTIETSPSSTSASDLTESTPPTSSTGPTTEPSPFPSRTSSSDVTESEPSTTSGSTEELPTSTIPSDFTGSTPTLSTEPTTEPSPFPTSTTPSDFTGPTPPTLSTEPTTEPSLFPTSTTPSDFTGSTPSTSSTESTTEQSTTSPAVTTSGTTIELFTPSSYATESTVSQFRTSSAGTTSEQSPFPTTSPSDVTDSQLPSSSTVTTMSPAPSQSSPSEQPYTDLGPTETTLTSPTQQTPDGPKETPVTDSPSTTEPAMTSESPASTTTSLPVTNSSVVQTTNIPTVIPNTTVASTTTLPPTTGTTMATVPTFHPASTRFTSTVPPTTRITTTVPSTTPPTTVTTVTSIPLQQSFCSGVDWNDALVDNVIWPISIVFAIDVSENDIVYIKNVISILSTIGDHLSQFAVVAYDGAPKTVCDWQTSDMKTCIQSMPWSGIAGDGKTDLATALEVAQTLYIGWQTSDYTRPIVVVLSAQYISSSLYPDPSSVAAQIRSDGRAIISVDLSLNGVPMLNDISSPYYYYNAEDTYIDPEYIVPLFIDASCFCPSGTVPYMADEDYRQRPIGGCYWSSNTASTKDVAEGKCAANGGALVSIHDREKMFFIKQQMTVQTKELMPKFWIDLTFRDGDWRWGDQEPATYLMWATSQGQPNPSAGPCVYSQQVCGFCDRWSTASCDTELRYVCEIPPCHITGATCGVHF